MRLFKILIPSALALAPAIGAAVPASAAPPSANMPATAQSGVEAVPVYHRGYEHDYYDRRHRHRYGYRYFYGPRCHWSRYWHRTVCR